MCYNKSLKRIFLFIIGGILFTAVFKSLVDFSVEKFFSNASALHLKNYLTMIETIIGLFCAIFGVAFILNLIGSLGKIFGAVGGWIAFFLFMAVYALLFATENSWLMFFPRFVGHVISVALNISCAVVMIYFIVKALTSKKFLLCYLIFNFVGLGIFYFFF